MTLEADFKILAPLSVTETELVSGIPDAENQVYASGTTYSTNDLVWYGGHIWKSLLEFNVGNTPVEGSWWTDLGEIDSGAEEYDAGTTYALSDYVVYQGAVYSAAVAGESGNTPSDTSVKWTRIGATTRMKAFDGFLQDAASLSDTMPLILEFTDLVTDLAILRATGTSVTITVTDDTDGEVYNETFSLSDDSGITDWWEYFFSPIVQADTVLAELPPYAGAEIAITFTGAETSVGQIVAGRGIPLGTVKVGTGVGIESYSIKDRDDFNRPIVVERPYSDTVSFDLAIETQQVGYVKRRLALRDAQRTLFFMAGGAAYGAVAYGFSKDFDILHSTPVIADCVLEVEGLG